MGKLVIAELFEGHHDTFETISKIALKHVQKSSRFDSVIFIARSSVINKVSKSFLDLVKESKSKLIIPARDVDIKADVYRGGVGYFLRRSNLVKRISKDVLDNIRFSKGDLIIFTTAVGYTLRALQRISRHAKSKGSKVAITIHSLEFFFPESIDYNDWQEIKNYRMDEYSSILKKFLGEKISKFIALRVFSSRQRLSRKLLKYTDGIILPAYHIKTPATTKPVLKITTRIPEERILDERLEIIKKPDFEKLTPKIVVPGVVVESRKDYESILNAAEKLCSEDFELIFLGKMISKSVAERIDSVDCLKKKITTFPDFVSEDEFMETLLNSHFVLVSMKHVPPYGKYKTTGSIGDALYAGVPIITSHDEFVIPGFSHKFGESVYDNIKTAVDIVKTGKYHFFAENAIEYSKKFTLGKLEKDFRNFVKKFF